MHQNTHFVSGIQPIYGGHSENIQSVGVVFFVFSPLMFLNSLPQMPRASCSSSCGWWWWWGGGGGK